MQRRTSEQTRALLIETGLEMLLERGAAGAVSHIRLQQVLKRAGLTTGAAYRLWPDQDAYHHDLAVHAARWRDDAPTAHTVERIGSLLDRGEPFEEVVRQASAAHVEGFEATRKSGRWPAFLVALALRATSAHSGDLRDASRQRHRESIDEFIALYGQLMQRYGIAMRPGRTLEQFAIAMAATGEGFALQAIEGVPHPRVTVIGPDGSQAEWTLFGLSVRALIDSFTEPQDPPVRH